MSSCEKRPPAAQLAQFESRSNAPPQTGKVYQSAQEPRRYIAVRHKLEIETRAADLQKAWDGANSQCAALKCEVVSASFTNQTRTSPASGSLSVRVVHEDLSKFLDKLGQAGNVIHHTTENEDRTASVIDVEAKLKNLAGFRDGLRAMLAKPPGNIKDLLEVQRELTQVQSELDGETTKRKVLADETDKVSIELAFHAEAAAGGGPGAFAPVAKAWRESINVLGESIATLISVTFALTPWILALSGIFWILRKLWRRRKKA